MTDPTPALLDRLRRAAELLPAGASITVSRECLLEALGSADVCSEAPAGDLTVAELASQFQRKPSTVRAWLEAGRFPGAYKLRGRDWRVPPAAVQAFREAEQGGRRRGAPAAADLGAWRRQKKPA